MLKLRLYIKWFIRYIKRVHTFILEYLTSALTFKYMFLLPSSSSSSSSPSPSPSSSPTQVWPFLTAGASVHIVDENTRVDPPKLLAWLSVHLITVCLLPTPVAQVALQDGVTLGRWPRRLRVMYTGGDKLHPPPACTLPFRFDNHYGPSEATIISTLIRCVTQHHSTPIIHPLYTSIAAHTPMYTHYTCIYTIYTPPTPLNTLYTPYIHPIHTTVGLWGGAAGIVARPLESVTSGSAGSKGATLGGRAASLLGGVGKGLLGAVTKPVGGTLEAISEVSNGIIRSTGLDTIDGHSRYHIPRRVQRSLRCRPLLPLLCRWKLLPPRCQYVEMTNHIWFNETDVTTTTTATTTTSTPHPTPTLTLTLVISLKYDFSQIPQIPEHVNTLLSFLSLLPHKVPMPCGGVDGGPLPS